MTVEGGCGSDLCAARAELQRALPHDPGVVPPCDACAAALARPREALRLALLSADCHMVGPL